MLQSGPRGSPPPPPRPSGISALPHLIAHAIAPVEHVAQVVQHSAPAQHYIATHSPPPPLSQARLTHVAGRTAPVASFEAHSLSQPAYLQAVADVFRAQSPQVQVRVARGLALQPRSPEFAVVRSVLVHQPLGARNLPAYDALFGREQKSYQGADVFGGIGKAVGEVGQGIGRVLGASNGQAAPGAGKLLGASVPGSSFGTIGGGSLLALPARAGIDIGRATAEDPGVIPKTLKGLGDQVVGTVAGTVELPIRAIQHGPVKAIEQLGSGIAQDVKRRYGPLAAGNDRAFINRIKQEGAGPELFDAFTTAGGLDATLGRAASAAGRAAKVATGEENFLTRERPILQLSGNKTRPQQLANTAGRAAFQRFEDWLRSKHKGELAVKGKSRVAPIFQSHAIRVVHSGIAQKYRRIIGENLSREVRGRPGSAQHAIGKLNHWQKQAVYHAVQGIRVDTAEHFRADLAQRYHMIEQDRANPGSLGNRIPAQHLDKVDELRLIDRLIPQAHKIVGPKMVAFQKGEAERAARIEAATALHPATAEARRLRPIGDRLGIEHPDVTVAKRIDQLEKQHEAQRAIEKNPASIGELRQARGAMGDIAQEIGRLNTDRPARLARYVGQVRAEMDKHGLPEPGFFRHQERPDVKYGDFTSGTGARAMPADKRSTFALHRAGLADTSVQAYLQGHARAIKRPFQWRLTDEQFRAAALPTPTRDEIRAALGQNKAAHLLTGNELRRVLEHRGEDMSKVGFVNPGRLAEQTLADHGLLPRGKQIAETHDLASEDLHHALNQEDIVQQPGRAPSERFLTTPGWKAVPKTALDEIQGSLKGSTLGGRVFGKVQGTSAGLILGQNPHFLIMNTLAHAIPAVAGTKGRILADFAKFPLWWHGLSDAERDTIRGVSGGRGGHYNQTARLGSQAPNQIAAFGRRLQEHGLVQKAQAVNPLHAILKAEDIQSNFFRHAVMYHELKRAAFQDMGHEFGRAVQQWESVRHIFSLGPQERMRAIMENQTKFEELGRTTVNILGDYGRFTNRERQFLNNRAVLFYSFLRHVTRTLLYVLPARHPLAFGLVGELGNLHAQEVKKLMGGQDLPWAYGRIFFDNKGKLRSVDLASTSPISSPLVDILSGGVKQVPRLISPTLAPILDVAYGQTPVGTPVQRSALTYLNDLLSLSYPYRQASAVRFGLKSQRSDSIPFVHERPKVLKTKAAQQYDAAKQQARGPLKDYLLGSTLGVYPKPDDAQVIARHAAQLAARKGKGRQRSPFPRGSSSGFGGGSGFGGSFGGGGFGGGFGG